MPGCRRSMTMASSYGNPTPSFAIWPRRYGQGGLLPDDEQQIALADQWLEWCKTTPYPDYIGVFWGIVRTKPDQRNPKMIKSRLAAWIKQMQFLDRHLAERTYVVGDRLTMADIPLGAMAYRYYTLPNQTAGSCWSRRLVPSAAGTPGIPAARHDPLRPQSGRVAAAGARGRRALAGCWRPAGEESHQRRKPIAARPHPSGRSSTRGQAAARRSADRTGSCAGSVSAERPGCAASRRPR